MEDLKVILRFEEFLDGTGLWLMYRDKGKVYCADRVELKFSPIKDYPMLPESTMTFQSGHGSDFLRGMANELTRLGFLPDIALHNEKQLKATLAHLEDMRSLVFKNNPYK